MPRGESTDLDILRSGCWRSITRAPDRGDGRLGDGEGRAVAVVEPDGQLAGELEVLALVVADRDPLGVVEEDVGGHEHRVGEQPAPGPPPGRWPLSLNWVIRRSSPMVAVHSSSQASRGCSGTWLWTNRVQTSGSRPAASRLTAASRVRARSRPGSISRVRAWRSTMQ